MGWSEALSPHSLRLPCRRALQEAVRGVLIDDVGWPLVSSSIGGYSCTSCEPPGRLECCITGHGRTCATPGAMPRNVFAQPRFSLCR
jgi:hypothetical protein